jgi:ubiquinone/menaquinone biosynthesis C-methylase UbiE
MGGSRKEMTYFDARAKDWDSDPRKVDRAQTVAEAIRNSVPLTSNMTALEYGCGTGLLSFALQPHLGRITLADSSIGMLEVLRGKIDASDIQNMHPVRLDLSDDPLPAERYDLIYSLMTLHHIPDTLQILKAFNAILRKPGILCLADLDKEDGSFHGARFDVHNGFDRKELARMLEQAGFGNIRFTTVYRMAKEVDGNKRTYPLFLAVTDKSTVEKA